jgi:Flp pilus assembly pilin Flp
MEYVLIIGVISLPLVTFLSIFGTEVIEWVQEHAPNIFEEAASWE